MSAARVPTYQDVLDAADTLRGVARRTPVFTSRTANAMAGAELFFKAENLQNIGAFKFRGAYNAVSRLSAEERARGVVTFSSGNHGQAIARAGAMLGVATTVIMPKDAPASKIAATRGYGAEVILFDRYADDREAIAAKYVEGHGRSLVPPYDHHHVAAGQGTAAKELLEEVPDIDLITAPVGGGGLLAGTALAAEALAPKAEIWGVEPEAGDDARQSLAAGRIIRIDPPRTLADGAQTPALGHTTFPVLQRLVKGIVTVPDAALIETMSFFFQRMKIVVEPTGCLSPAAAMNGALPVKGRRVGIIISGGNADPEAFAKLLAS
jgi:threonine dehydratase